MAGRIAGARVDGMRIAPAVAVEVAAVVAGGGDGQAVQRHQGLPVLILLFVAAEARRRFQRNPPRHAVRLDAMAAQFAADLGEMMGHALGVEVARHRVDGKALGDGAEIQ
ncbi:hypothetical protein D3C72_1985030 [compost metagenome]